MTLNYEEISISNLGFFFCPFIPTIAILQCHFVAHATRICLSSCHLSFSQYLYVEQANFFTCAISACPCYNLSSTFTWPCNVTPLLTHYTSLLSGAFQWLCIAIVLSAPPMFLHTSCSLIGFACDLDLG